MTNPLAQANKTLSVEGFAALIAALAARGHEVIGPRIRDGAITLAPVSGPGDLPRGVIEEQSGGQYRLREEGDLFFAHTVGPDSWKRILHPPKQRLWTAKLGGETPEIIPEPPDRTRYAFLGVRGCDLAAIAIQDKVFLDGPYADPHYAARRAGLFIVAVNCTRAAETCFCSSMGTGPRVAAGFDIALSELGGGRILAEAGSDAGAVLLEGLPGDPAGAAEHDAALAASAAAEAQMTRRVETDGLPELLRDNPEHPRWSEVATRCLNCANCTMVCPTCFCTGVSEISDLDGVETARESQWASCFTTDFSHVHGGAVRKGAKARYRQWMSHKLSTWVEQFGGFGCTGCGRCITWCPVGIDITEEAAAIRADPGGKGG